MSVQLLLQAVQPLTGFLDLGVQAAGVAHLRAPLVHLPQLSQSISATRTNTQTKGCGNSGLMMGLRSGLKGHDLKHQKPKHT